MVRCLLLTTKLECEYNTRNDRGPYLFRARRRDRDIIVEVSPDSLDVGGVNDLFVEVTLLSMNILHHDTEEADYTGDFLNPNDFFGTISLERAPQDDIRLDSLNGLVGWVSSERPHTRSGTSYTCGRNQEDTRW